VLHSKVPDDGNPAVNKVVTVLANEIGRTVACPSHLPRQEMLALLWTAEVINFRRRLRWMRYMWGRCWNIDMETGRSSRAVSVVSGTPPW
jgi:hypothetical protein